ncbi:amidase [Trichoderma citrinoviride]|uniref:Amidase n=1 Tax=Trichoderma citrinoviride TaxID=58853 RepID=A0A2T4BFX3_9HYPO|nr:amidase [Trichoderma citrinoviride]PTB68215.1 amidase [Trichoderma citrinoviride]
MPPPDNFANYPDVVQGPDTGYDQRVDHNPVLRGLPLTVGAEIISRSGIVSRYFLANSGITKIKDMPELDNVMPTFHPTVTPLGPTGPMLEFEPELLTSKHTSSSSSKFRYYSAADYHAVYKSGALTPLQVVETLLGLTTAKGGKYSDAWADAHGAEKLAVEAARASTERWAAGRPLGVLDGVPVGVKDDTDVKGYVNHFGMRYNGSLPAFAVQEESAWPVKKLQEAGAVVLGKNTMHELGSDTSGLNVVQGTPTNHLNNAYYPGGSSNGAGSSISAGIVPICVGTDAGGSIRIPANFNGVYGLKPTHHRTLAMEGTVCVTGPLAATAADLTIAYRLMSQPDASCPTQARFALSLPPAPSSSAPRVMGVFRDWFNRADPPVRDLCDRALDHFASRRGYQIVDVSIPFLPETQVAHAGLCIAEMAEKARRRTPHNPAHHLSLVGPANKILLSVGAQVSAADYLKANALRTVLMRHLAHLFQKHPGLLIMTPTTPLIGWPRSPGDNACGMTDANITLRNMSYIFLANMTGVPSVTAPVGYVDPEQGEGKLPVSLLATGEWGSEEQLLAWAREAEDYLHETYPEGRRRPDSWADVFALARGEQ